MAKDYIKRLFYGNETTFFFENNLTKMRQHINVIENYNIPLYDEYKVRKILDNINCPNNYFKSEVNIWRYNHSDSF